MRRRHSNLTVRARGDDQPRLSRRNIACRAVCFVSVGLLAAATHWPALQATAVGIDDHQYLTRNRLVQTPGWASVRAFLVEVSRPETVQGYYQPLAMISLMLDSAMGGDPAHLGAYHRTSVLLHAANAVLVAILLFLLFGSPGWACGVGLLFGLHPLAAWETPWISERKTLLATFFALLCLVACTRYAQSRKRAWYVATAATLVLALLSKPTTVTLPAVMVLLDFWPLRRLDRRSVLEKLPFFVIALVSAVLTLLSQAHSASVTLPVAHAPGRLPMVLCHNIGFYLREAVWPSGLTAYYAPPESISFGKPAVWGGIATTVLLLILALVSLRWTRAFFACFGIFLVAVLPALGIIGFTETFVALRHLYLPLVGLSLLAAWLLICVSQGLQAAGARWARAALVTAVGAACLVAAHVTRRHLDQWRSTETLFTYMARLAPGAGLLRHTLGLELSSQGRLNEAIAHYRAALGLRHASSREEAAVHSSLGVALQEQGLTNEATACFRRAVELCPALQEAQYNLGMSLARQGDLPGGAEHLGAAALLAPEDPEIQLQLGNVLLVQNRTVEAIRAFEHALRLSPDLPEAHNNMGFALASAGQPAAAEARFRRAIDLAPSYVDAYWNLARLLFQQGRYAEADGACRAVLQYRPDHEGAKSCREAIANLRGAGGPGNQ